MNLIESKILDDTNTPDSNPPFSSGVESSGDKSNTEYPVHGQINEDRDIASRSPADLSNIPASVVSDLERIPPRFSIEELRTNSTLARHVLLQLWREGLLDKDFRSVVMRDIGTLISVYGSVEPMYSTEAASRLLCCSRELLKWHLRVFASELKEPYYVIRKVKRQGFRQKIRLVYASDIQTIREKTQRKGKYRNGRYSRSAAS